VGSHLFDIAHYVLGPIKRVTGFTKLIPRQRKDRDTGMLAEVEVDDIAAAWFVHEAEVQGQLFASHVTPSSGEKAYIEVIGSKGALRAALSRGSVDALRASTPDRPEWRELPLPLEARDKSPHCLGLMMRSFVDACLRGKHNTEVDASFHEGLAAQRALAAVHQSSIGQAWVSIKQTL
jgi:predicted dehydrogenase